MTCSASRALARALLAISVAAALSGCGHLPWPGQVQAAYVPTPGPTPAPTPLPTSRTALADRPVTGGDMGTPLVTAVRYSQAEPPQTAPGMSALPATPVGEAPPTESRVRQVAAIPENMTVLSRKGSLTLDPSIEYTRSSANRLVFRGVEIVPGIQIGVIEANDADRDTVAVNGAVRYGLTDRLEIEGRVPYVRRSDRVTTVAQRDETVSRTMELDGQHLGDVEFAGRYQLTSGARGRPIFVANLRVKTPTGRGPFEVNYDEFGVATDLATGSGFWAVEPGVTMLYASDPAVIFAGLTYLHSFPEDVNKTLGGTLVGKVEPGDSVGAALGFGFALNPRLSFSLGYSHNYIAPTKTVLGGVEQSSNSLQVGSLLLGGSFRVSPRVSLNTNFEFGVTSDAPDVRIGLRVPYRF